MTVAKAKELRADYLWFVDADQTFNPDALTRLLSHNKDIVGATYARRCNPHETLGAPEDGTSINGLMKMKKMPTGCLLIKMNVFDTVKRPWFPVDYDDRGELVTEDYVFCRKAKEAGFEIWCDMRLSLHIGHIGQETFFPKPMVNST